MPISNKEINRVGVIGLLIILLVLSFLVLRPILLSIIGGLILAYIFMPVYKRVYKVFRERNTSALAVCIFVILIIFIPLWFLIPLIIQQVFNAFTLSQSFDINSLIETVLPTSSPQIRTEVISAVSGFIGNITTTSLNALAKFLIDLPNVLLNFAVVVFVFFFTLRDQEKLRNFVSEISPLRKEKQKEFVNKFKEITSSLIFGFVVVGIIQGVATGIGMLIFGVPQALLLTVFAVFASILPMIGPWLVWVPVAIYLFSTGSVGLAVGFTLYGLIVVSTLDNFLRPYIVAKKTGTSSVIILIGMIGGLFVFGLLGLILGPLILSYMILLLNAYKDKSLAEMFNAH